MHQKGKMPAIIQPHFKGLELMAKKAKVLMYQIGKAVIKY